MTTDTVAEWTAVVAAYEAAKTALQTYEADPANEDDTAEGAALSDAEGTAWAAMVHTPAPDVAAMVTKLRALFDAHIFFVGDDVDNPAFLTRLLDENRWAEGFPLVRLLQDALRLAGEASPILDVTRSIDKPWPVLATEYRSALAARNERLAAADIQDDIVDAEERRLEPMYRAVLRYPVSTVEAMAEKASLIEQDCRDHRGAYRELAFDAARIAGASA